MMMVVEFKMKINLKEISRMNNGKISAEPWCAIVEKNNYYFLHYL
jgi:hypothetical protein